MAPTGIDGDPFRGVLDAAVEHERTPYEAFPDVEHLIEDESVTGTHLTDHGSGLVQQLVVPLEAPPEA